MKKLICKKCGHKETLEDINLSINTKILIAQVPRVREKDGLHIYPLYCLKCNYITEWAADPNNNSGKAIGGVEYFKTFKINKKFKQYFEFIENDLVNRGYTKSETIKYSIGWIAIIVGLIAVFNQIPAIIENRFDTIPNTTATFASIAQNLAPLYLSADLQIPTTV